MCLKVISCCSNLPGRGFSKLPLETTSITMGEIMEKVLKKRRLRQREGTSLCLPLRKTSLCQSPSFEVSCLHKPICQSTCGYLVLPGLTELFYFVLE